MMLLYAMIGVTTLALLMLCDRAGTAIMQGQNKQHTQHSEMLANST